MSDKKYKVCVQPFLAGEYVADDNLTLREARILHNELEGGDFYSFYRIREMGTNRNVTYMKMPIELSTQDIWDISIKEHDDYELVESNMVGKWRHGTEHEGIIRDKETGKFYKVEWRSSVKDGMTLSDMIGDGPHVCPEVEAKKKEVTVYE